MKKMLAAVLAAGVMSVSAFGFQGTISEITIQANTDSILLTITDGVTTKGPMVIVGQTTDSIKAMLATALTAKSTGATVDAYAKNVNGQIGWGLLILK